MHDPGAHLKSPSEDPAPTSASRAYPIRRLLRTFLAATSGLLCMATLIMWSRSSRYLYCTDDILDWDTPSREMTLASSRGELSLSITDSTKFELKKKSKPTGLTYQAIGQDITIAVSVYRAPNPTTYFGFGGLYYARSRQNYVSTILVGGKAATTQWDFGVPYWLIVLITVLPPALWYRSWRTSTRPRRGFPPVFV
jgi:hypothetical protein